MSIVTDILVGSASAEAINALVFKAGKHIMQTIVFHRPENLSGRQLISMLKPLTAGHGLTTYSSVTDLSNALRKSENHEGIAILIINSTDDLDAILDFKGLFWKYQIILILPDMERKTVARAVQLFPRYMTSPDQGLNDIKDVVCKLMNSRGNAPQGY